MAEVIEFYVPRHFRQKSTSGFWHRGKLIEFRAPMTATTDERPIQSDVSEGDKQIGAFLVTSL